MPAVSSLSDDGVRSLLAPPLPAVISTLNPDGSILSVVVWYSIEDGVLAVNGARGRRWSENLERDPQISFVVYPPDNPYEYVAIHGTASGSTDDAFPHTDRLAKRYLGLDAYPYHAPGDVRVKFTIAPAVIRHQKQ
jgi:PPOX class probable F420-dependent enzyme